MTITPTPVPGQWALLRGEQVRVVGEFPADPERVLIQTPAGRVLSVLVSDLTILGNCDVQRHPEVTPGVTCKAHH